MYATPVHITPSTSTASQARGRASARGASHKAGSTSASVAPSWLPVAVTSGGTPVRKRLVALAAMP
jgi:hypothetical protein